MSASIFARCSASCASRAEMLLPRLVEDRRVQAQPARNLQRQAAPGRAVVQPVGGRERLGDRTRTPRTPRRPSSTHTTSAARSASSPPRARRAAGGGPRWRGPSAPPSTGSVPAPDLVEQHQRRQRQRPVHLDDVGHVPREGAQARGNRLLVADVGEHATGTPARASPCSAGTCSPACAISASRPAVFSATVLPPVFGPGDDEHRRAGEQLHVDRHRVGSARSTRAAASPPVASAARASARRCATAGISSGWRAASSSNAPSRRRAPARRR